MCVPITPELLDTLLRKSRVCRGVRLAIVLANKWAVKIGSSVIKVRMIRLLAIKNALFTLVVKTCNALSK